MHIVPIVADLPTGGEGCATAVAPSDFTVLQALARAQGTFRRQQFGLVPAWGWPDALARCIGFVSLLDRAHLVSLLDRGSDQRFQQAVLARYDGVHPVPAPVVYLWEWASALDRAECGAALAT